MVFKNADNKKPSICRDSMCYLYIFITILYHTTLSFCGVNEVNLNKRTAFPSRTESDLFDTFMS